MEAKTITIKPFGKRTDSSGWHMGVLKAFDSESDMMDDKPKYESRIDMFDTHGDLKQYTYIILQRWRSEV